MKRKIILGVFLLIVVIGSIVAWKYFEKNDDIVNQKPDAKIEAVELIKAFEKDSANAREKYMDKVIEVKGVVTKIDSSGSITLGNNDGSKSGVVFGLDKRYKDDYKKLNVGGNAILQGRCIYYDIGEEMMGMNLGTTIKMGFSGVKKGN